MTERSRLMILRAIKRRGLSQVALCKRIRLAPSHFSNLLSGVRPLSPRLCVRLGRALGLPPLTLAQLETRAEIERLSIPRKRRA